MLILVLILTVIHFSALQGISSSSAFLVLKADPMLKNSFHLCCPNLRWKCSRDECTPCVLNASLRMITADPLPAVFCCGLALCLVTVFLGVYRFLSCPGWWRLSWCRIGDPINCLITTWEHGSVKALHEMEPCLAKGATTVAVVIHHKHGLRQDNYNILQALSLFLMVCHSGFMRHGLKWRSDTCWDWNDCWDQRSTCLYFAQ